MVPRKISSQSVRGLGKSHGAGPPTPFSLLWPICSRNSRSQFFLCLALPPQWFCQPPLWGQFWLLRLKTRFKKSPLQWLWFTIFITSHHYIRAAWGFWALTIFPLSAPSHWFMQHGLSLLTYHCLSCLASFRSVGFTSPAFVLHQPIVFLTNDELESTGRGAIKFFSFHFPFMRTILAWPASNTAESVQLLRPPACQVCDLALSIKEGEYIILLYICKSTLKKALMLTGYYCMSKTLQSWVLMPNPTLSPLNTCLYKYAESRFVCFKNIPYLFKGQVT